MYFYVHTFYVYEYMKEIKKLYEIRRKFEKSDYIH